MPEFFNQRISKAKKSHRCCECGHTIHVGMLYWYCSGKWDGRIDQFRQHIECRDACYRYQTENSECLPFGCLTEQLGEYGQTWELGWGDQPDTIREKSELEKYMRSQMAAGIRASRLRPDQIPEYNARHAGRST